MEEGRAAKGTTVANVARLCTMRAAICLFCTRLFTASAKRRNASSAANQRQRGGGFASVGGGEANGPVDSSAALLGSTTMI